MVDWITPEQQKRVTEIAAEIAKYNKEMKALSQTHQASMAAIRAEIQKLSEELENVKT